LLRRPGRPRPGGGLRGAEGHHPRGRRALASPELGLRAVSVPTLRHVRLASVVVIVLALVVTATALAGRGDPKERFTPADQARARAMLLRVGDLNAAYAAHPAPISSGGLNCAALDESDLTLTGRGSSPIFTAAGEFVSSSAAVYKTRAD